MILKFLKKGGILADSKAIYWELDELTFSKRLLVAYYVALTRSQLTLEDSALMDPNAHSVDFCWHLYEKLETHKLLHIQNKSQFYTQMTQLLVSEAGIDYDFALLSSKSVHKLQELALRLLCATVGTRLSPSSKANVEKSWLFLLDSIQQSRASILAGHFVTSNPLEKEILNSLSQDSDMVEKMKEIPNIFSIYNRESHNISG